MQNHKTMKTKETELEPTYLKREHDPRYAVGFDLKL